MAKVEIVFDADIAVSLCSQHIETMCKSLLHVRVELMKIKDVIPHKLTLEQRKQSKYIYARYKHPGLGVWREKSIGTTHALWPS